MGKHDDKEADRQKTDGQVDPDDVPNPNEPKPNPHSDE